MQGGAVGEEMLLACRGMGGSLLAIRENNPEFGAADGDTHRLPPHEHFESPVPV